MLPLVDAYRHFYGYSADSAGVSSYIADHLRRQTSTLFVAERDAALLGFAQLFQTYSTTRLRPALILEDLYVDVAARGGGIATALLERCLEFARESGAAQLFLETALTNETAQRVYERAGWKREATFIKYNAPL